MQHFKLWIFGSNGNPNTSWTFDYKFDLQFLFGIPMLMFLLQALLWHWDLLFVDLLLNLGFVHLLGILLSLANLSLSNLLLKLIIALLFLLGLTFASKPSNLKSHFFSFNGRFAFLKTLALGPRNWARSWNCFSTWAHKEDILKGRLFGKNDVSFG